MSLLKKPHLFTDEFLLNRLTQVYFYNPQHPDIKAVFSINCTFFKDKKCRLLTITAVVKRRLVIRLSSKKKCGGGFFGGQKSNPHNWGRWLTFFWHLRGVIILQRPKTKRYRILMSQCLIVDFCLEFAKLDDLQRSALSSRI